MKLAGMNSPPGAFAAGIGVGEPVTCIGAGGRVDVGGRAAVTTGSSVAISSTGGSDASVGAAVPVGPDAPNGAEDPVGPDVPVGSEGAAGPDTLAASNARPASCEVAGAAAIDS